MKTQLGAAATAATQALPGVACANGMKHRDTERARKPIGLHLPPFKRFLHVSWKLKEPRLDSDTPQDSPSRALRPLRETFLTPNSKTVEREKREERSFRRGSAPRPRIYLSFSCMSCISSFKTAKPAKLAKFLF
jgi:hypothetical protein